MFTSDDMANKCCVYVPKFPIWNIDIHVWKWSMGLVHHIRELPDIHGQIQQQDQSAAIGSGATCYMRYQSDDDRLRDPYDYGSADVYDAVSFELPSGREVFYRVQEVQGMGNGFPNAHMVATLEKLSNIDATVVQPPYPPPAPTGPVIAMSELVADPWSVAADGASESIAHLTLRRSDGSPADGITCTLMTTGDVVIDTPVKVTDAAGLIDWTATNSTIEASVFTASWPGIEAPGYIQSVTTNDWYDPGDPPVILDPIRIVVALFGNVGTSCCSDLNGDWVLTGPVDGVFSTAADFDVCFAPYTGLKWFVWWDGTYWQAGLGTAIDVDFNVTNEICHYTGPYGDDIDPGSGMGLTLVSQNAAVCDFFLYVQLFGD